MRNTADTLIRQWNMLRSIPRSPARSSTADIRNHLLSQGFDASTRTVQRDLDTLSATFAYTSENHGKALYWYWPKETKSLDLPGMDLPTALTFQLAERHLNNLLPPQAMELLSPWFGRADELLAATNESAYGGWQRKVAVISQGPKLQSPQVNADAQDAVYNGLLHSRKLTIDYRPRYKPATQYTVSPLGIVLRSGVTYLVCSMGKDEYRIHLALHRMDAVVELDEGFKYPEEFDLNRYVSEKLAFSLHVSDKPIKLKIHMDTGIAQHVIERPLSDDQQSKVVDQDLAEITATVQNTAELRWWLLGFGDQVKVVAPKKLTAAIKEILSNTLRLYS
jgi:predicted DNA-binding transcriptional regulator YafY